MIDCSRPDFLIENSVGLGALMCTAQCGAVSGITNARKLSQSVVSSESGNAQCLRVAEAAAEFSAAADRRV